jgi:molecular chaperone GrpE
MNEEKPKEINNTELEECKIKCEDYLNNWKRERADFANYKKDEARRVEEFIKFANESLILEIIDSMDDLYVIAKNTDGIEQVIKNFEKILARYGVGKIKVEGEFDPSLFEAVETEEGGSNLREIRVGWTMYGKVIRPARVKIVKQNVASLH